ncbi:RAB11-binding protein RELCH homolog [Mytilus galloprovincialis]|uniref:RAB11-binding protein RELCH homolog n=1 Tax=Mytilus galloprovincialis TaxID=29158 RepID=UPI003F7C4491
MADRQNTNPFLDDDSILEENTIAQSPKSDESTEMTLDSLAARLLKENLLLTALELHTELTELGREVPRLRDYFSNPGNFERTKEDLTSPTLQRASSIQTFDSLDFARYSDDGGGQVDERVAVLEFELRKAQDTIKSLRASLTKEAETDSGPADQVNEDTISPNKDDPIKPLERKALNFLVNEYLLQNNYKLTSVTFSEENEEQDFEDWDDVGLNIARPPDLLHLYKDFGSHTAPLVETCSVGCMVCFEDERIAAIQEQHKLMCQEMEIRISQLEIELDCCKIEKDQLMLQLEDYKSNNYNNDKVIHSTPSKPIDSTKKSDNSDRVSLNLSENSVDIVENGMFSIREMGDGSETLSVNQITCDSVSESSETNQNEDRNTNENTSEMNQNEEQTIDTTEGTQSRKEKPPDKGQQREKNPSRYRKYIYRRTSVSFQRALRDVCFHVSKDNRLINEVSQIVGSDTDTVVLMLSRCLPHIVPNVLLAKREELIPLIICTAMLHPNSKDRDRLLNILFNLIKKPDEEQRNMILTGIVAFAQHVGQQRLEEELLPQCWEQINHKYPERRILVAEACGALSPYIPNELLSSLVLSMLQQMLMDDKDDDVREAVIRSLGLIVGFIQNPDKYTQGYELLKMALKDTSEKVVIATQHVFLPSFAMWACDLDKLQHNLIHSILRDLEDMCAAGAKRASTSQTIPLNEGRFLLLLSSLKELVTFLYISVISSGPYLDKDIDCDIPQLDEFQFPKSSSPLTDLNVIIGDSEELSSLVHRFHNHLSQEWFEPWDSFNWVVNNFIPRLLEVVMGSGLSMPKVITQLCSCFLTISRTFGKVFVEKKVRPKFIELLIQNDDEDVNSYMRSKQTAVTTSIIPVYASGVLTAFNSEEDKQQLCQFLHEILCTLSLYQAPLESLKSAISVLSCDSTNHELLLTVLWEGVVHTSAQVRASSARLFELLVKGVNESLVSSRVFPALVTLGNDPEILVRTSTIPALGAIIENVTVREMLDRAYMQFLTFMDDSAYRDEHKVHLELIHTLARVGPNTEPKFREEFILPRLAAMASANNHMAEEKKKREIALELFEAYSSMSCCVMNDQLVRETMLPGLRCLQHDMVQIAPEHEEVIQSMIRDYETKMELSRSDRSSSFGQSNTGSDDVKSRMMSRLKDTANLSNIFTRKK